MRELEGGAERPGLPPGGGVIWYAYRSCIRQVSDERDAGATGLLSAPRAARRGRVLFFLPWAKRVCGCEMRWAAEASGAGLARWSLRAFFHALRATAACLRARFASRLASFIRLRAR